MIQIISKHPIPITQTDKKRYFNRRANGDDLFEELSTANLERECVEEHCTKEEINEYYEDTDKTEKFYALSTNFCTSGILVGPENTPKVAEEGEASIFKCLEYHNSDGTENEDMPVSRSKTCQNYWRSIECTCNPGFTGTYCEKDLNECEVAADDEKDGSQRWNSAFPACAASGGECSDSSDTWSCLAPNGFKWAPLVCGDNEVDVNGKTIREIQELCGADFDLKSLSADALVKTEHECAFSEDCAAANSKCEDNKCVCNDGYSGDANSSAGCVDIDECASDETNNCNTDVSICRNVSPTVLAPEGFICDCKDGYAYPGDTGDASFNQCVDIDECDNEGICPMGTYCSNEMGSFSCKCDDDELYFNKAHGTCCPAGQMSVVNDGCADDDRDCVQYICKEINECTDGTHTCGNAEGVVCHKEPGAAIGDYTCQCGFGYIQQQKKKTLLLDDFFNNGTFGDEVDSRSDASAIISSESENPTETLICVDENECLNESTCDYKPNSYCVNTIGWHKCLCNKGYKEVKSEAGDFPDSQCVLEACDEGFAHNDAGVCVDVDECALELDNCAGPGSQCSNTEGGYVCSCSFEGYRLDDFNTCVDINWVRLG